MREEPSRCPDCGYTLHDCQFHGDHYLCRGPGPEGWKRPSLFAGLSGRTMLRVLVTGGRFYSDGTFLTHWLDRLHGEFGIAILGHGKCHKGGADLLADQWAVTRGVSVSAFPVDHRIDGPWPAAGPRRNGRMFREFDPDALAAFPGDRGTNGMVDIAKAARADGHRVEIIDLRKPPR